MRRDVPEPWATAMITAGITDPRYTDPRPSMSQLAQRIGVHTSTVSSMVFGERATDQATIEATARTLRLSASTVAEWVGRAEANPYTPPSTASLMTTDQRNLIDGIIRQFTREAARGQDRPQETAGVGEREQLERAEGVPSLNRGALRGELRDAVRRRTELVGSSRRLDPDEVQLVAVLSEKIARLEAVLNPATLEGGQAEQTGS